MFALVYCISFYRKSEGILAPRLKDQSAVILSQNDGCLISCADKAKTRSYLVNELIRGILKSNLPT